MYSNGPSHMAQQNQDDQREHTYSSYVRIRDVVLKTCRRRWTIGRSGERGSAISVLAARHDDDDDDDLSKSERLEFEIASYDSAVHRFNHYTARTSSQRIFLRIQHIRDPNNVCRALYPVFDKSTIEWHLLIPFEDWTGIKTFFFYFRKMTKDSVIPALYINLAA